MAKTGNPWDRQFARGESAPAFAAFLAYRDLGPGRTVVAAYRHSERKPDAKQADGTWNKWPKTYDWKQRAAAWDAREEAAAEAAKAQAVAAEAAKAGRQWVRVRDEQLTADLEAGRLMAKQGLYLLRFPVTTEAVSADGKSITYEAADPKTLAAGARVTAAAREVIWGAIDRGLKVDQDAAQAAHPVTRDAAADAEGFARVLANRARLRDELLRAPPGPPGSNGQGNGTGNGAAH